jgi:hypothetical protein
MRGCTPEREKERVEKWRLFLPESTRNLQEMAAVGCAPTSDWGGWTASPVWEFEGKRRGELGLRRVPIWEPLGLGRSEGKREIRGGFWCQRRFQG